MVSNLDPEEIFQRDPADPGAFTALERRYRDRAEWRALAALYEQHAAALTDQRQVVDLLWQASQAYRRLDDDCIERRILARALTLDPANERTLKRLAELADKQQRWAELLRCLLAEVDLAGANGGGATTRAQLHCRSAHIWHHRCHRLDKAVDHYRLALSNDPACASALSAARQLFGSIGQWEDVADLCRFEIDRATSAKCKVDLLSELAQLLQSKLARPEQAAQAYQEAAKLRPADDAISEQLADLYASPEWPNPGGLEQAAALFVRLAQRREARNDREGAIAYYRRALGADPEHAIAARRLQRAYEELERWDELERLCQQRLSVAQGPDVSELQRRRGDLLQRHLDRPAEAARCYEAVVDSEPATGPSWDRLQQLYSQLGEQRKLVELLRRRASLGRDRVAATEQLMQAASLLRDEIGEPQLAAETWRQVLELHPGHRQAIEALEEHLAHKGDYQQLAELLRFSLEASALANTSPIELCEQLEKLAQIQERQLGDIGAARETWDRVARLHPDRSRASAPLRNLDIRSNQIERQLQELEQAQQRASSPTDRLAVRRLVGTTLHELGVEHERAIEALRDAVEQDPADDASLARLADLYRRRSDADGLTWVLQRRLSGILTRPERISALRELGRIEAAQEHLREAISALEELLQLAPKDEDAFQTLCRLLEQTDDHSHLGRALARHATTATDPQQRIAALGRLGRLMTDQLDLPDKAIDAWEGVVAIDQANEEASEQLIALYQQTGRTDRLLVGLRRRLALEEPVQRRIALLRLAADTLQDRPAEREEAIGYYEEITRLQPGDRAAWVALTRLYEQQTQHLQLAHALARVRELSDDPTEQLSLAFAQIDIFENQLLDSERALEVYQVILDVIAPANLEAHRRLKLLHIGRGRYEDAIAVAEREYFLAAAGDAPTDVSLELALEIAELWQQKLHDVDRAILAYERVLALDPDGRIARERLHQLYVQADAYLPLVELAPLLLEDLDSVPQRHALMLEMANVWETKLGDADQAFDWYRQAYEVSGDAGAAHAELQRLAREHGLWHELMDLYQRALGRSRSPADRVALLQRLELISHDEQRDPESALGYACQAIYERPEVDASLVGRAEQIALEAGLHERLFELYQQLYLRSSSVTDKLEYLQRAASLAEEQLGDPQRAVQQLVRGFRLSPQRRDGERSVALERQLHGLAKQLGDWSALLYLFRCWLVDSTDSTEQLELLCELAQIYEHELKDIDRAFTALLHALMLDFSAPPLHQHLWRLASQLADRDGESTPAQLFAESPLVQLLEQTDPAPPRGTDGPASAAPPRSLPPNAVATAPDQPLPAQDSILELSSLDLVELDGDADALLPSLPLRPPPSGTDPSPWRQIEAALEALAPAGRRGRAKRLLQVAEMWERGADDPERALALLAEAAALDPDLDDALDEMDRLAEQNGWLDRLLARYGDLLEQAADGESLVRLHRRVAELLQRHGRLDEAEQQLTAALSARPQDSPSAAALQQVYERTENWPQLAGLIERRLRQPGLDEPQAERRELVETLVEVYQHKLDDPARAAEALASAAQDDPADAGLAERVAELYEQAADWPKHLEWLKRVTEIGTDSTTRRRVNLRRGLALERELELPNEAIQAYCDVLDGADPAASAAQQDCAVALERLELLYRQHNRLDELVGTLRARAELPERDATASRMSLLEAAAILQSQGKLDAAIETLELARRGGGADENLEGQLAEVLRASDRADEAARLLADQVVRLESHGSDESLTEQTSAATVDRLADTLVALARIRQQDLDDPLAARAALERAMELVPDHAGGLRLLAQNQREAADWESFALTSLRLSDGEPDDAVATTTLVAAAQQLASEHQAAAAELLERALQRSPDSIDVLDALLPLTADPQRRHQLLQQKLALALTDEQRAVTHTQIGAVLAQLAPDSSAALEAYKQAHKLAPDLIEAVEALSDAQLASEQSEAARTLLETTIARLKNSSRAAQLGPLYFRLGEIYSADNDDDLAYRQLLEARRLRPKDLSIQLSLGQNRFRTRRWREALRYLAKVDEHPDAGEAPGRVAAALFNGGLCERRLRRPARALPLFEAALRIDPSHPGALRELAEAARIAGNLQRTAELQRRLANVSHSSRERISLLASAAQIYSDKLRLPAAALDCRRQLARDLVDSSASAIDSTERARLLVELLPQLQQASEQTDAGAVAHTLAQLSPRDAREPRLNYLLLAADHYEADGAWSAADACRREALTIDQRCDAAVAGLARAMNSRQQPDQLTGLVEDHLQRVGKGDSPPHKHARAELYALLGAALADIARPAEAVDALERSLRHAESTSVRERLAQIYKQLPEKRVAALANYRVLARDVGQISALEALAAAAVHGAPYRSYCLYSALRLLGHLDDAGRQFLDEYQPPDLALDQPFGGTLTQADRSGALAVGHGSALNEVLESLWDSAPVLFDRKLEEFGTSAEQRISPLDESDLARAFSKLSRALEIKNTALYLREAEEQAAEPIVVAATAPPALVVSREVLSYPLPRLRFTIGRALELSQPPKLLAVGFQPREFAELIGDVLRAFHPRHLKGKGATPEAKARAQALRGKLPYKHARRLGELFRERPDAPFDSVLWRQAAQLSANRVGLVLSGDLSTAWQQLLCDEPQLAELPVVPHAVAQSAAARDLLTFAVSDAYHACRVKLGVAGSDA